MEERIKREYEEAERKKKEERDKKLNAKSRDKKGKK